MKPNLRLKRERERRGWSQARIAKEIGIYPQSVSRWERGAAYPYPYFREKLCALFGMDAEALGFLSDEDDTEQQCLPPQEQPTQQLALRTSSSRVPQLIDPALPVLQPDAPGLIGRQQLLSLLKQRLLSDNEGPWTLLRGLPGVGKTTLALALAHDPEIQAYFRAGILWSNLGSSPLIQAQFQHWNTLLAAPVPPHNDQPTSHEHQMHALRPQRSEPMLFILDDVWDILTMLALKLGGERCHYLVTTRFAYITYYFAPNATWHVPPLHEQESVTLLAHYVPMLAANDTPILRAFARKAGGLPLALTIIGSYLRAQIATSQSRRLQTALQQLQQSSTHLYVDWPQTLISYQVCNGNKGTASLHTAIASSVQQLDETARQALFALSLFPPSPNSFSEQAILAICQVPVEVVDRLSDMGLLESSEEGRYQLHPTIMDYAHLHFTPDEQLTQRFIDYMLKLVETEQADYNALDLECQNIIAALKYAWQLNMSILYIRGVIALSDFLEVRAAYPLAEEHLQQAYQVAKQLNEQLYTSIILFHLGQIARAQNLLLQAETYLREGLLYARKMANRKMVNHFLITIAEVLELRGEYTLAHTHLHKGLILARYLKDEERVCYHRVPINYSRDAMCVHFTEPQSMLERGYLANIDELFYSWPYADALSPDLLKIVTGRDGHIYGIPIDAYTCCLAYNRRFFREAGLDPDAPPTTWGAFRAAARQIARPRQGRYGFAAETISGQGGWHFTNWLYTAGVRAQRYNHGSWQATFNASEAVRFLEMLREMRFTDESMPRQAFLTTRDTEDLLISGQVGMIVSSPHLIALLHSRSEDLLDDIGLAPMPQQGSNACLMGGVAYVFNAKSSPRALKTAFAHILAAHFHMDDYEAFLREAAASGEAIGIPYISLFKDEWRRKQEKIQARYTNVPRQHYKRLLESHQTPWLEPPIEAQKYYAMIDPIIQAMLTDSGAHPQHLLDTAAHQFQEYFLQDHDKGATRNI